MTTAKLDNRVYPALRWQVTLPDVQTMFRSSQFFTVALRTASLAMILFVPACASSPGGSGDPAEMKRGDRYLITAAELADAGANNLYDAVAKIRPDFFRPRGNTLGAGSSPTSSRGSGPPAEVSSSTGTAVQTSQLPVRVYYDTQMLMGVDDLRQIPMSSVAEVRFIPGPQAGVRYGTNHSGGVILVKSR